MVAGCYPYVPLQVLLPARDGEVAQDIGLKFDLRNLRLQHVAYADDAHNLSAIHNRNMPDATHGHNARARERKEMMALGLDPDALPDRKPPSDDGDDPTPTRRAKAFA